MSMPRPGVQTTRVGFLVFVALAILVATIMSLGGEQKFWERKVQYEVHFARTNGLQVGAPVSLTGVTIGSIAEMRFPPDPTASYIQVLVNVLGDATPRIHENSVATIRTFGLLTPHTREVNDLFARANHAPKSLDEMSDRLNRGRGTFGKLVEDEAYAARVLANLDVAPGDPGDVAEKLARGGGTLGKLVND